MSWNLDSDRPIFLQIMEHIQSDIVSGTLPPGSKVPSVRELASEAAVNPNTMQRALAELERMGLMRTERTSGRFITEDSERISGLKQDMANTEAASFLKRMQQLGLGVDEIMDLIKSNANA